MPFTLSEINLKDIVLTESNIGTAESLINRTKDDSRQYNPVELIMAETLTREAHRSSKCVEKLFVTMLAGLVPLCFAASAVGLLVICTYLCRGCSSPTNSSVVNTYWVATVTFFLLGVIALAFLMHYKRRNHSTAATSSVVISSIPPEDLEKSPAPTLRYNRVPQRQQLAQASSTHPTSLDLPDYFSVVQNIDEVYSFVNADYSPEDVPETPPPCYEEAIEITSAMLNGAGNDVDTYSLEQYAFTEETMEKSNEIFV